MEIDNTLSTASHSPPPEPSAPALHTSTAAHECSTPITRRKSPLARPASPTKVQQTPKDDTSKTSPQEPDSPVVNHTLPPDVHFLKERLKPQTFDDDMSEPDDDDFSATEFFIPEVSPSEREKYPEPVVQRSFRANFTFEVDRVPEFPSFDANRVPTALALEADYVRRSVYLDDLLEKLVMSRKNYKQEIESLARMRQEAHDGFQELFEDKLEYVEIQTFCKCKKSIRARHEYTTTEFKLDKSTTMQKLLVQKVRHMSEELPLAAYQSFLARLRIDCFLYTLTVEQVQLVDPSELVHVLTVLFKYYTQMYNSASQKLSASDPGSESYLRSWIERYLSFLYQNQLIDHMALDLYLAKLAIKSNSAWAAHLVRVSESLGNRLSSEQWLVHCLQVCKVLFTPISESVDADNEDCILAAIDRIPWKTVTTLMVDHRSLAEQFLVMTGQSFSLTKSGLSNGIDTAGVEGKKQLIRRICSIMVQVVQVICGVSANLQTLNYFTTNTAILLDSCFFGSGCAYFFFERLPLQYLSPDSIAQIFSKLYFHRHAILQLPQQDQIGLLSAFSSLATTQYCPVSVMHNTLEYLISQLLSTASADETSSPTAPQNSNTIRQHSTEMISFVIKAHPFLMSFLINHVDENFSLDAKETTFPLVFDVISVESLAYWNAAVDDFYLLKNWLFSGQRAKIHMSTTIFKKYNWSSLPKTIVFQIQSIFLEYELCNKRSAPKWMIEILLLLDLEHFSISVSTENVGFAAHTIIDFFDKKCHAGPNSFTENGVPLLKALLMSGKKGFGSGQEYTIEVCQLLQRSDKALGALDGEKHTAVLSEMLFLVVGKSQSVGILSKLMGNENAPYTPSDGCKLLTKTALYLLERSDNLLDLWCYVFFKLEGDNVLNNPNVVFSLDKILNHCLKTSHELFLAATMTHLRPMFNNLRADLQLAKKSKIQLQPSNAIASYFTFFEPQTVNAQNYLPPYSFVLNFPYYSVAPYLSYALLLIDCDFYAHSKHESIWPAILRIFSKNPVITCSEALESAVATLNDQNSASAVLHHGDYVKFLPPILAGHMLLTAPDKCAILPLICYTFFKYFFDRREDGGKTKRVGLRVFYDDNYRAMFSEIKARLEQELAFLPQLSGCRLWLDEPRLMLVNDQDALELPDVYNPEFLNVCNKVQAWLRLIDVVSISEDIDRLNKHTDKIELRLNPKFRSSSKDACQQERDRCDNKIEILEKLAVKSTDLLESTLTEPSREEIAPGFSLPIVPLTFAMTQNDSGFDYIINQVHHELKQIMLYSASLVNLESRVRTLDDSYMAMVPSLYSNVSVTTSISVSCSSGFASNTCMGAAVVPIKHKEKRFNSAISGHVKTNRDQYKKVIQGIIQTSGWELGVSESSMKVLFPNKTAQSNVKDGFITSGQISNDEAPPDYALPENDCPALTALQFEQIAEYLKQTNAREACDTIFEKVLEARLQSKNLVARHILLDFIEKITPFTNARRLIQQIVDFIATVRFQESYESKISRQLKMEDVASLVSHFKPENLLTDYVLYRQVTLAISPDESMMLHSSLSSVSYLKEIEAQMFFSILTKFDLSNPAPSFAPTAGEVQISPLEDVPITLELTHKALATCRNSIRKYVKSEKKKRGLADDLGIEPPTWCCALVEQLCTHYITLLKLCPDKLVLLTLENLLHDAAPPLPSTITNKSTADYDSSWKVLWGRYVETVIALENDFCVTHCHEALLQELTGFFLQHRHELDSWNTGLNTQLTHFLTSLLMKKILPPTFGGTRKLASLDITYIFQCFDPFIGVLQQENNADVLWAWSDQDNQEHARSWFRCLFTLIVDLYDLDRDEIDELDEQEASPRISDNEIRSLIFTTINYWIRNISKKNTPEIVQSLWATEITEFLTLLKTKTHALNLVLPQKLLEGIYAAQIACQNLTPQTVEVFMSLLSQSQYINPKYAVLRLRCFIAYVSYVQYPTTTLLEWRALLAQLENDIFLLGSLATTDMEALFSTAESYFNIEYFLSDPGKQDLHDSWEFVIPQDGLAQLLLKVSGLVGGASLGQFDESDEYVWKMRQRAVLMLYNLTDKTGSWNEIKFSNEMNSSSDLSLRALSLFYAHTNTVKSDYQQYTDYLKFWTQLVTFIATQIQTNDAPYRHYNMKEDMLTKMFIICGLTRNLEPHASFLYEKVLQNVALNFHWLEQPKIVQTWMRFQQDCLLEKCHVDGCLPQCLPFLSESDQIMANYCRTAKPSGHKYGPYWVLEYSLKIGPNENERDFAELDFLRDCLITRFDTVELVKILDILVGTVIMKMDQVSGIVGFLDRICKSRKDQLDARQREENNKITNKLPKLFSLLGGNSRDQERNSTEDSSTVIDPVGSKISMFLSRAKGLIEKYDVDRRNRARDDEAVVEKIMIADYSPNTRDMTQSVPGTSPKVHRKQIQSEKSTPTAPPNPDNPTPKTSDTLPTVASKNPLETQQPPASTTSANLQHGPISASQGPPQITPSSSSSGSTGTAPRGNDVETHSTALLASGQATAAATPASQASTATSSAPAAFSGAGQVDSSQTLPAAQIVHSDDHRRHCSHDDDANTGVLNEASRTVVVSGGGAGGGECHQQQQSPPHCILTDTGHQERCENGPVSSSAAVVASDSFCSGGANSGAIGDQVAGCAGEFRLREDLLKIWRDIFM